MNLLLSLLHNHSGNRDLVYAVHTSNTCTYEIIAHILAPTMAPLFEGRMCWTLVEVLEEHEAIIYGINVKLRLRLSTIFQEAQRDQQCMLWQAGG